MTKEQREQQKVEKMEQRLSEMQVKLEQKKASVVANNSNNDNSVPVNPLLSSNEEEKQPTASVKTFPNVIGNQDEVEESEQEDGGMEYHMSASAAQMQTM